MDWLFKAVLTAGVVLLVMVAARQGSRKWAGVVAALPTITAPTLAWLAHEEGVGFAISAAVGSVAACAMLAVFALGYARVARYGIAAALVCGLGGAMAIALPAKAASARLADALMLALGCCGVAFAAMPSPPGANLVSRQRSPRSMFVVAVAAGGFTALVATVGPSMGGFATGLLSSLPLITGSVAIAEHTASGHRAATHFLRGYVGGLFGKAAFGAAFALLAPRVGAVPALALACACVGLTSTIRTRQVPVAAASLTTPTSRR